MGSRVAPELGTGAAAVVSKNKDKPVASHCHEAEVINNLDGSLSLFQVGDDNEGRRIGVNELNIALYYGLIGLLSISDNLDDLI